MSELDINKRPTGVLLIAIYTGVGALLSLLLGIPQLLLPEATVISLMTGVIYTVLGFLFVAAIYGLWTLKAWGYKLIRGIYMLSIVFGCMSLFSSDTFGSMVVQGAPVAFAIWIMLFLQKEKVMLLFQVKS